jgi:hypothetical protein
MRQSFIVLLGLLLISCGVFAQETTLQGGGNNQLVGNLGQPQVFPTVPLQSRNFTPAQCSDAGGAMMDVNPAPNKVCVLEYETICGTSICNDWNEDCVTLPDDKGKACVANGAFMTPDASVLIIAQIIVAGIFLSLAFIGLILNINVRLSLLPAIITGMMLANSFMLFFSYYYLNAYITLAAAFAGLILFSQKTPGLTVAGMFLLLFSFFWVTYSGGLGYIQHHSRYAAGESIRDTYEVYCNSYYHGYFSSPAIRKANDENPQVLFWGFCTRPWLAAVLFFMILQELYLVLLTALACHSLLSSIPNTVEPIHHPHQHHTVPVVAPADREMHPSSIPSHGATPTHVVPPETGAVPLQPVAYPNVAYPHVQALTTQ